MHPNDYDTIIVYFSGGKDSLACLLHLIEIDTDMSKVELWHHEIDGRESSDLMDWPITPDYCRALAQHFSLPIYFSWKVNGFEGEMNRNNSLTKPTKFETPNGSVVQVGGIRGKPNTRRKFPQVSADLKVRWCSAYLKIDIAATAIRNQNRFNNSKTLTISGERAEESPSRAKYKTFEPDRTDNRNGRKVRLVDRWRPVHKWSESDIWEIIEKYKINPHPAYHLGWGRVSCLHCIFGNPNQCASARIVDKNGFETIALYEIEFNHTIHQAENIIERANRGMAYQMNQLTIDWAMSKIWRGQIQVDHWTLPSGAFGESCGPT